MKTLLRALSGATAVLAMTFVLGAASPAQAADGSVTLIYNGAVRGELEDCGCPKRPLGGLARRAHLIEEIKADRSDAILLDAGSLFGDPTRPTLARSRFLAAETAKLGYDVIGIGPYELGHGVEAIRQIAASSGLHFVSSNVERGGDLLFEPYRIIERGGMKVAVTSVFDPDFIGKDYMVDAGDIEVTDPVKAMRTWLPEMDAASDVVVVLMNLSQSNNVPFLRQLNESGHDQIDVLVDGIWDNPISKPRRFGSARMISANSRGKYVGEATITVSEGKVSDLDNEIHFLDLKLPEDPAIAVRVKDYLESSEVVHATND